MRKREKNVEILLNAVTAPGDGEVIADHGVGPRKYQAYLSNTTTPEAQIQIKVRNEDNAPWENLLDAPFTLSGANDSEAITCPVSWAQVKGVLVSISGVNAAATLTMGV